MAGGTRRPDRERAGDRRQLVGRGRGAERRRGPGDAVVRRVDRLPDRRAGSPDERRLGREPDGDRLCPGDARGTDGARARRVRDRSGPLVAAARRARARLSARPAARPPDRRIVQARPDGAERRAGRGRGAWPPAAVRRRERRIHEHRRDRPADGDRRRLPRPWHLVARRRRVRWLRRAHGARSRVADGPRARGLGDRRSAQVAVPALGVRRAARAGGRSTPSGLRDRPGLPARDPTEGRRGQLRRHGVAALASAACAQGLALDPHLRARRVPGRDRPLARPRRPRARPSRRARPARARRTALALDHMREAAISRCREPRRRGRAQPRACAGGGAGRARARHDDDARGSRRDPPVRPQPRDRSRRHRRDRRPARDRRRLRRRRRGSGARGAEHRRARLGRTGSEPDARRPTGAARRARRARGHARRSPPSHRLDRRTSAPSRRER